MSNYADVDDERAERVNQRFDEMYRFLRDLIDDPTPLQLIPDGSMLEFRTVRIGDEVMQLTAHRLENSSEPWTARVTTCFQVDDLSIDPIPPVESPAALKSAKEWGRCQSERFQHVLVAPTAEAALDTLENVLQAQRAEMVSGR